MSSNIYTVSLNSVGSYQVSGAPFASGSINVFAAGPDGIKIEFPYVTSWVQVINNSFRNLAVGFSSHGIQGTNFFTVQRQYSAADSRSCNTTGPLPLKVTELYLSASQYHTRPDLVTNVSIVAGLTNSPVQRVTNISPSGSNWSGSVGVG
jgi:hypothetical protein